MISFMRTHVSQIAGDRIARLLDRVPVGLTAPARSQWRSVRASLVPAVFGSTVSSDAVRLGELARYCVEALIAAWYARSHRRDLIGTVLVTAPRAVQGLLPRRNVETIVVLGGRIDDDGAALFADAATLPDLCPRAHDGVVLFQALSRGDEAVERIRAFWDMLADGGMMLVGVAEQRGRRAGAGRDVDTSRWRWSKEELRDALDRAIPEASIGLERIGACSVLVRSARSALRRGAAEPATVEAGLTYGRGMLFARLVRVPE